MLDLSFGLPIVVRDQALKLVAQGPNSGINREYYAQNNEGALTDGQVPEEYDKTDSAARNLLKRLATSEPYYKRPRRTPGENGPGGQSSSRGGGHGGGPDRHGRRGGHGGGGGNRGGGNKSRRELAKTLTNTAQGSGGAQDYTPPADTSITSLFLVGYV